MAERESRGILQYVSGNEETPIMILDRNLRISFVESIFLRFIANFFFIIFILDKF